LSEKKHNPKKTEVKTMTDTYRKPLTEQLVSVALLLAVIGSALFMVEAGFSDTWDIMTGDQTNVSQEIVTTFGGDISTFDRIAVGLMVITLGTGLGILTVSRDNPDLVNQLLTWFPVIGLLVGLFEFSEMAGDMLDRSYDFSLHSEATNALNIAVFGWIVAGVANAFRAWRN
jgi:hypothetical protein